MANQHTQSRKDQVNHRNAIARIEREITKTHATYMDIDAALFKSSKNGAGFHSFGTDKTQEWPIERSIPYRLMKYGTARGDGSVKTAQKLAVEFVRECAPSALDRIAREV